MKGCGYGQDIGKVFSHHTHKQLSRTMREGSYSLGDYTSGTGVGLSLEYVLFAHLNCHLHNDILTLTPCN